MDEITAGPRVGTMLEDRPHLLLALEPQQRHGGVGLALRQPVLGLFGDQRPVPDRVVAGIGSLAHLRLIRADALADAEIDDRAKPVRGQPGADLA